MYAKVGGFILLAAIASVGAFDFSAEKLDCNGIEIKPVSVVLSDPAHACNKIKTAEVAKNDAESYGLVEECLCNLVPRQAIWKAMVTPDVVDIFRAMVDALATKSDGVPKGVLPMDNERVWLETFERLSSIERREPKYANYLRSYFMILLGEKFVADPKDRYWPEAQGKVKEFLRTSCGQLSTAIEPYLDYFEAAGRFVNNGGLTNMITSYDHNLFKALVAYRACKHAEEAYVN